MNQRAARAPWRPRGSSIVAILLGGALVAGCVSSQLDVPTSHPGHPQARTGQLRNTEALTSEYDVEGASDGEEKANVTTHDHQQDNDGATSGAGNAAPDAARDSQPGSAVFTCPMHPEIVRNAPGNCPICGMKLVPQEKQK